MRFSSASAKIRPRILMPQRDLATELMERVGFEPTPSGLQSRVPARRKEKQEAARACTSLGSSGTTKG